MARSGLPASKLLVQVHVPGIHFGHGNRRDLLLGQFLGEDRTPPVATVLNGVEHRQGNGVGVWRTSRDP